MKRDMELIRKILYAIEEKVGNTAITDSDLNIDNYSMDEVGYHCAIMYEGGLISHFNGHYYDGQLNFFSVGRLTWNGHELLDQIRNDTIWNKTKTAITSKGARQKILCKRFSTKSRIFRRKYARFGLLPLSTVLPGGEY